MAEQGPLPHRVRLQGGGASSDSYRTPDTLPGILSSHGNAELDGR